MAFTSENNPSTGRKKGAKNKATLLKEERRAMFEAKVSQDWEETISKLRPEYVADQFMGKAPDKVEHTIEMGKVTPAMLELAKHLEELRSNTKGSA